MGERSASCFFRFHKVCNGWVATGYDPETGLDALDVRCKCVCHAWPAPVSPGEDEKP